MSAVNCDANLQETIDIIIEVDIIFITVHVLWMWNFSINYYNDVMFNL